MLTISITIEAELNAKLDETSMFLDEETEKKLDDLMTDLENECKSKGLDKVEINYDFYDDDDDEYGENILSEGITVTEIQNSLSSSGWTTEEAKSGEVEEDGRKYKKS